MVKKAKSHKINNQSVEKETNHQNLIQT